jgi:hypothetical protein
MQGAMVSLLAFAIAMVAYVWSYARNRDKIRSLLIATLFLGGGFALGKPLLGYIYSTPERALAQKRQVLFKATEHNAAIQALKQYAPNSYDEFLITLASAPNYQPLKPGEPAWNIAARDLLSRLLVRENFLGRTSDPEVLAEYAKAIAAVVEHLDANSPEDCVRYLKPEGIDGPKLLSTELLQTEADAMASVIRAGSASPTFVKAEPVSWQVLEPVANQIREEFQADPRQLWEPWKQDVDAGTYCKMARRFIKTTLRQPEPERSQLLRVLLKVHG